MRKNILACIGLVFLLFTTAASGKLVWYPYDSGLGADGYDLVAYFDSGSAERGSPKYAVKYDGQLWYFASAASRAKFVESPDQYLPQYGGYCAYAASLNAQAFGDPQVWTVHKGKLYFNYNAPTRGLWERGVDRRITKGDIYWRDVLRAQARDDS